MDRFFLILQTIDFFRLKYNKVQPINKERV